MPLPTLKLTPLQTRFASSLAASAILLILYLSLTKPHFAYAHELDAATHPEGRSDSIDLRGWDGDDEWGAETHKLDVRAVDGVSALANNAPQNRNINIGEVQNWMFPRDAIEGPAGETGPGLPSTQPEKRGHIEPEAPELRRRQDVKQVWISVNVCLQPSNNNTAQDTDEAVPPQLSMYISQSESNQTPGPDSAEQTVELEGGHAMVALNASSDVYVGLSAPNTTTFSGIWNYEIAASIDAPFFAYANVTNLHFVDGDNHAALLITNDTTQALPNETVYQQWMELSPAPYGLFAAPQSNRPIWAVRNSFCGLRNNVRLGANLDGFDTQQNVGLMTNRGLGGKPKEQFYITGLNQSTAYWGFLVMQGNSTASGLDVVGGGGTVWSPIEFQTKQSDNCALMYNLSFCSEVAYAVPTNPERYSPVDGLPQLAAEYDSYASQMYQYFNYSLQQIPCNTTSSAQYSLARNCDDCARAYKQWLCAVTIPRCADYSATEPYLKLRNLGQTFANGSSLSIEQIGGDQALLSAVATNTSRNPRIDEIIRPGPYKEVLPCEDLCYDLVQSCPAALGFGCPGRGDGFEDSYGVKSDDPSVLSCSYLGAAYYLSGARSSTTGLTAWMMGLSALSSVILNYL